ncbi:MAG TPA: hypothetical protein VGD65_21840 [Chryseosolibacter sp.]
MKKYISLLFLLVFSAFVLSCNKEEDPEPENNIDHVGEKWNIVSVEYSMINQNLTNPSQLVQTGTATNAGAFYFNSGKGSFDVTINTTNKQDYFSYTENGSDVSVTSISQNVGGSNFSQNVIALSGQKTSSTTMTLDGTITQQSMTGQFSLTATFTLQKN